MDGDEDSLRGCGAGIRCGVGKNRHALATQGLLDAARVVEAEHLVTVVDQEIEAAKDVVAEDAA